MYMYLYSPYTLYSIKQKHFSCCLCDLLVICSSTRDLIAVICRPITFYYTFFKQSSFVIFQSSFFMSCVFLFHCRDFLFDVYHLSNISVFTYMLLRYRHKKQSFSPHHGRVLSWQHYKAYAYCKLVTRVMKCACTIWPQNALSYSTHFARFYQGDDIEISLILRMDLIEPSGR